MPAKLLSKNKNKKLTDFFGQGSSVHTGSATTTRAKPATCSSKAADCEPTMNSSAPPHIHSISAMVTRKRARSSADHDNHAPPFPLAKLKHPRKPAKIFQSDRPPVTSHNTLAQTSTPVKSHNTLIASPSHSGKEIVYSSQSDEAELVLPNPAPRDLEDVVEGVHKWRRNAFESLNSTALRVCGDAMEVDPKPSSPIPRPPTASAHSASLPSFDMNKLPPLPSTPQPIDSETKTAMLIAEIKARAFAASQSSDDEQPLVFRALEDSDDDDIIDKLPLIGSARPLFSSWKPDNGVFSSPLSSVPSTFDGTPCHSIRESQDFNSTPLRLTRASARTRKPVPMTSRLPHTMAESSSSVGVKKSVSFLSKRKKPKTTNPVHALLREKQLEEQRGANIRLAEEAIRQGSHERFSDDELETINRLHLADEEAAWRAVLESHGSTSPAGPDVVEGYTIGDRESKMLGAAAGEAIDKILAGDKDSKAKVHSADQEVTSGVLLWTNSSNEDMVVDSIIIPPLSGHPILTSLDGLLRSDDDSLVDLIIRDGSLLAVPSEVTLSNIPQLLTIALVLSPRVSDAVYIAFRDLWELKSRKVQMPVAAILFALAQLGANSSVLEGLGMTTELSQKNCLNHEILLEAIQRLLRIMTAASCADAFSSNDVPNITLILATMGLDPMTSSELRTQLNITMDVVCNHNTADDLFHDVHGKVLNLARQLVPSDKARLVSCFASGSGCTRRIAQRLAYTLLVPAYIPLKDQAPTLEPLITLLSPDTGSGELFDVTNESMDYEELEHYVYMLSIALTDIAPYVEEERALMKSASTSSAIGSPSRLNKMPSPPLEQLLKVLEILQSKIVDTRAAHLDRSRTKAAIHGLTMRIYYDRMALMGTRPCRTLKAYFSPQRR